MDIDFERRKLHLDNFDYSSKEYGYFVTICCKDKRKHFKDLSLSHRIAEAVDFRNRPDSAIIYCYTIMPDHVHIVLRLADGYGKDLMEWVASFKRFTSKFAKSEFGIERLWQKNFYDHIIRDPEALKGILTYVVNNPVRKEIVAEWEDYSLSQILNLE